jgi:hypothetical protein
MAVHLQMMMETALLSIGLQAMAATDSKIK